MWLWNAVLGYKEIRNVSHCILNTSEFFTKLFSFQHQVWIDLGVSNLIEQLFSNFVDDDPISKLANFSRPISKSRGMNEWKHDVCIMHVDYTNSLHSTSNKRACRDLALIKFIICTALFNISFSNADVDFVESDFVARAYEAYNLSNWMTTPLFLPHMALAPSVHIPTHCVMKCFNVPQTIWIEREYLETLDVCNLFFLFLYMWTLSLSTLATSEAN